MKKIAELSKDDNLQALSDESERVGFAYDDVEAKQKEIIRQFAGAASK